MGFKSTIKKWRKYSKLSDLGIIARRKFFNNCFDGVLTCAGIVSGAFVLFLFGGEENSPSTILILGFSTAIAIGISGLWGAFLSEEAGRKKKLIDIKREMVIIEQREFEKYDDEFDKEILEIAKRILKKKQIEKAMVIPSKINDSTSKKDITTSNKIKSHQNRNSKTMIEKAENFATIFASIVDGIAPLLGSALPLIPFFFGVELMIFHFLFSYIILVGLLVYLGIFLGNITGKGHIKYVIHLVLAGVVSLVISLLLSLTT